VPLRPRTPLLAAIATALFILFASPPWAHAAAGYRVGVGIGDITGEAAEVGMLGYADPTQTTAGLATRQRARAIVIAYDAGHHVAFVSAEVDFVPRPCRWMCSGG
jgi:neutral ceramidase